MPTPFPHIPAFPLPRLLHLSSTRTSSSLVYFQVLFDASIPTHSSLCLILTSVLYCHLVFVLFWDFLPRIHTYTHLCFLSLTFPTSSLHLLRSFHITPLPTCMLSLPHLSSPANIQLRVASLPLFFFLHLVFLLRISFHVFPPTRTSAPFLSPSLPLPFTSYTPSVSHLFPSYTLSLFLSLSPACHTRPVSPKRQDNTHMAAPTRHSATRSSTRNAMYTS